MSKQYLGDGAYAEVEGDDLKLTTENGIYVTNVIYLDKEGVQKLLAFIYAHNEELRWQ